MSFQLFTGLFNKIDAITTTFIMDTSARSIAAITPVVSVGLTISFIAYGLLILRGVIDMPIMDFLGRSVKIGIITSIALTGGLYQAKIANAIHTIPDDLINALVLESTKKSGAAAAIDQAADKGFSLASKAFDHAGLFSREGITYCMFGVIILIATSVFIALGGAILLLTKLVLAILIGIGPFFIMALLWQSTARFFDMWAAQVLNYILLAVLATMVFGLMLSIYSSYMNDMKFDGVQNVGYTLGGAVVLSAAMIIILIQVPNIAAGLAGGVSLSYLYELRTVRGGAAASYITSRDVVNNPITRAGARQVKEKALVPAGRALKGYYKGTLGKKSHE